MGSRAPEAGKTNKKKKSWPGKTNNLNIEKFYHYKPKLQKIKFLVNFIKINKNYNLITSFNKIYNLRGPNGGMDLRISKYNPSHPPYLPAWKWEGPSYLNQINPIITYNKDYYYNKLLKLLKIFEKNRIIFSKNFLWGEPEALGHKQPARAHQHKYYHGEGPLGSNLDVLNDPLAFEKFNGYYLFINKIPK